MSWRFFFTWSDCKFLWPYCGVAAAQRRYSTVKCSHRQQANERVQLRAYKTFARWWAGFAPHVAVCRLLIHINFLVRTHTYLHSVTHFNFHLFLNIFNFHCDFFEPWVIWKCVINFQITEDLSSDFPLEISSLISFCSGIYPYIILILWNLLELRFQLASGPHCKSCGSVAIECSCLCQIGHVFKCYYTERFYVYFS